MTRKLHPRGWKDGQVTQPKVKHYYRKFGSASTKPQLYSQLTEPSVKHPKFSLPSNILSQMHYEFGIYKFKKVEPEPKLKKKYRKVEKIETRVTELANLLEMGRNLTKRITSQIHLMPTSYSNKIKDQLSQMQEITWKITLALQKEITNYPKSKESQDQYMH